MLTDKQIEKYKLIYKNVVGEEISTEEVLLKGTTLITLMEKIYTPITREQYEKLQIVRLEGKIIQ